MLASLGKLEVSCLPPTHLLLTHSSTTSPHLSLLPSSGILIRSASWLGDDTFGSGPDDSTLGKTFCILSSVNVYLCYHFLIACIITIPVFMTNAITTTTTTAATPITTPLSTTTEHHTLLLHGHLSLESAVCPGCQACDGWQACGSPAVPPHRLDHSTCPLPHWTPPPLPP